MIYVDFKSTYICKLTNFNGLKKKTFAVQNIFMLGFFLAKFSSSLFDIMTRILKNMQIRT